MFGKAAVTLEQFCLASKFDVNLFQPFPTPVTMGLPPTGTQLSSPGFHVFTILLRTTVTMAAFPLMSDFAQYTLN